MPFPDLRMLLKSLMDNIWNGTTPGSDELQYRNEIIAHGGISSTVEHLIGLVLPEVLSLQGVRISPQQLNSIMVSQRENTPWATIGGYADYVTDNRHADYLRNYVGQSTLSERRILRQHVQSILGGSFDSLHYFIIWLGNGHRTANFIQLWSFPAETNTGEQWYQVRANILELLFCTAFGGHHGVRSSCIDQTEPGGVGLNVVSPLIQGAGRLLEHSKLLAGEAMSRSPDPQIRYWTLFRWAHRTVVNRPTHSKRPLFAKDFKAALEEALGDKELFSALTASLNAPTAVDGTSQALPDINAIGTLSSRIGMVLDYAYSNPAVTAVPDVDPVETASAQNCFPWPLPNCGLTANNTAVWTFDFKSFSTLSAERLQDEPATDEMRIRDRHRSLVAASQLKIILLCGPRAESSLRAMIRDTRKYTLELCGFRYRMYVDDVTTSDSLGQGHAKRLFIRSPELAAKGSIMNSTRGTQLSELLRFAVSLAGLQETCRPYYIESSNAIASIFKRVHLERGGYPRMTTDTLDDGIRLWLARKGISEDRDIRVLKERAGSLTWGLLMLLSALPRQQRDTKDTRESGERHRLNVKFDMAVFAEVRQHVSELVAARNAEFALELCKLQAGKGPPKPGPSSWSGNHRARGLLPDRRLNLIEEESNGLDNPQEAQVMAMEISLSNQLLESEDDDEVDNLLEACALVMETSSSDCGLKFEEDDEPFLAPPASDSPAFEAAKSGVAVALGWRAHRAKRTELPRIPVAQLDGSHIHINKSGKLMLRVYCGIGGDDDIDVGGHGSVNVNVSLGSRFIPQADEIRRTIHFTEAGIDIRDSTGNTIINRNATTNVATFPRDRLEEYADGALLIRLWECITGGAIISSGPQRQLPSTAQRVSKPPQQGDPLWSLNEFLNEVFSQGGEWWTGSPELYPDSTDDNERFSQQVVSLRPVVSKCFG